MLAPIRAISKTKVDKIKDNPLNSYNKNLILDKPVNLSSIELIIIKFSGIKVVNKNGKTTTITLNNKINCMINSPN